MKNNIIVLSLGGSLIIPDKVNYVYLKNFRKVINANKNKYRFVVVCGGGSLARKYISVLRTDKKNQEFQSYAGISSTRTNARFMNYFFGVDPDKGIPHRMKEVKNYLKKKEKLFFAGHWNIIQIKLLILLQHKLQRS